MYDTYTSWYIYHDLTISSTLKVVGEKVVGENWLIKTPTFDPSRDPPKSGWREHISPPRGVQNHPNRQGGGLLIDVLFGWWDLCFWGSKNHFHCSSMFWPQNRNLGFPEVWEFPGGQKWRFRSKMMAWLSYSEDFDLQKGLRRPIEPFLTP